jgi:hypothetical protein
MGKFKKSSATKTHRWKGQHRFEHWYRDNTIYFITSKARDGAHVFRTEHAKRIFWDRFAHWTQEFGFIPIITSLLSNHYHAVGYLKVGNNLGKMMPKLHGSIAKLVNDTLPARHLPFWRTRGNQDYFDGCLRSELQFRRTYRYVERQAVRARVCTRLGAYPHIRVNVALDRALRRATELKCFLETVPYARYDRPAPRPLQ